AALLSGGVLDAPVPLSGARRGVRGHRRGPGRRRERPARGDRDTHRDSESVPVARRSLDVQAGREGMANYRADRQPRAAMMRAGRAPSALRAVACALIAAAATCWPAAARAASGKTEGIAGWEGDSHSQGFGFAALGWLIPAGPKRVAPLRVTGSYLYYDFESSGTITRVHSPGLALIAGIRLPGQDGSLTFLGGGEVR